MTRSSLLSLIGITAIAAALVSGCNKEASKETGPAAATGEKKGKITVGVMPKLMGIDYFSAVERGAKEAGKDMGVEVVFDGPMSSDVTKQAEMIDAWITRKFDVIAVAPDDPHALAPTLSKAVKRGIKVLSYDSDSDEDSRTYFVNQATGESIGNALVDVIAEQIGGKGEVAIVSGSLTAANQNLWIEAMRKRVADKYPEMKIVAVKPSEEDQLLAFQVTQDLLKAYPNLKAIFGITSIALPGAAQAVRESGNSGKVAVTGLSTPKSMKQYVDDGTVKTFLLWNPVDLGYLTVAVAAKLQKDGKLGDKIDAGRLKDIQVSGTQVLLGPPMRFNKENIGKFDF